MTDTIELSEIIETALENAINYNKYLEIFEDFANTGQTSGPNQTPSLINFTKLNFQRTKRNIKTVELTDETIALMKSQKSGTWLLITETWCGDAANSVPIIAKMAEASEGIDLKIVLRDENLPLIDNFLTNGGRSIPKLIMLDEHFEVKSTWGPRPNQAQQMYLEWKNSDPKLSYEEFSISLQKWYMADKGLSTQSEIGKKVK